MSEVGNDNNSHNDMRAGLQKKRWYQKTGWIILLLFAFFPLGLFLMWKYTDWMVGFKIGISSFVMLILLLFWTNPSSLSSIRIQEKNDIVYDIHKPITLDVTTEDSDYHLEQSAFHSEGGSFDVKNDKITFTADKEGSYVIWAEALDVKSNKITLKIEDKLAIKKEKLAAEKKAKEAKKQEEERIAAQKAEEEKKKAAEAEAEKKKAAEAEAEKQRIAQAEAEKQKAAQAQAEEEARQQAAQAEAEKQQAAAVAAEQQTAAAAQSQDTTQEASTAQGAKVWKSETGSKYHNKPDCGRMNPNTATQILESDAKANGLEPCEKCFG